MALIENTLDGLINKVDIAIQRLRYFEPPEGYALKYSGGKDSVCILRLAQMAGVKFDAKYNLTTVDPPELVRFVKATPGVQIEKARYKDGTPVTMWNLIPKKRMPPTRLVRYCCDYFKERSSPGRVIVTGVRWAESANRKKRHGIANIWDTKRSERILNLDNDDARRMVEQCYRTRKTLVNPIVDWEDEDVWEFIHAEKIPYCGLYDVGYKRLGCIGCPMNTKTEQEFNRYPKYKAAYVRAFDRMLKEAWEAGIKTNHWRTGEEVMDWWLGKSKNKDLPLFEDEGEE